jgi:hypothetical protein
MSQRKSLIDENEAVGSFIWQLDIVLIARR